MRILAVIVNLVPYHLARWGAVAAAGHQLTVLQRRAGDPFAVLGTDAAEAPFAVHTLAAPTTWGSVRSIQTSNCWSHEVPAVVGAAGACQLKSCIRLWSRILRVGP